MAIELEYIAEVLRYHFKKKIGRATPLCPVCATTSWINTGVQVVLPYDGARVDPAARVTPFVVLVCHNCANTLFVAWVPMETLWQQEGNRAR